MAMTRQYVSHVAITICSEWAEGTQYIRVNSQFGLCTSGLNGSTSWVEPLTSYHHINMINVSSLLFIVVFSIVVVIGNSFYVAVVNDNIATICRTILMTQYYMFIIRLHIEHY